MIGRSKALPVDRWGAEVWVGEGITQETEVFWMVVLLHQFSYRTQSVAHTSRSDANITGKHLS